MFGTHSVSRKNSRILKITSFIMACSFCEWKFIFIKGVLSRWQIMQELLFETFQEWSFMKWSLLSVKLVSQIEKNGSFWAFRSAWRAKESFECSPEVYRMHKGMPFYIQDNSFALGDTLQDISQAKCFKTRCFDCVLELSPGRSQFQKV